MEGKLVIYSVLKTGTSAIDKVLAPHADIAILGPAELKHLPVYRYNRFVRPLLNAINAPEMEFFAMVREPYDWLGSWFKYRSRPDLDGSPNSTRDIDFDSFVLAAMQSDPPPYAHVGSPARFMKGGVGDGGVTHLFQYEQMEKACAFLQERLGHKMDLPQINVSTPREYTLSDKIREKYRRKRSDEFDLWEQAYKP